MSEPLPVPRIGDRERDLAVDALREHLVAGRLDEREFDERVGAALSARTQPELDVLFTDLPLPHAGGAATTGNGPGLADAGLQRRPEPIWTSWLLLPLAVVAMVASRGELGWLVPVAALWVFWIGPGVWKDMERRRIAREHRDELGR